MARNFVRINRDRLDIFLRNAEKLKHITLRFGILEGRTRYPRKRIHDPSDTARLRRLRSEQRPQTRLGAIRMLNRQLKQIGKRDGKKAQRLAERDIRRAFKAEGLSSKGLVRRGTRGTAVARVAGVQQAGTDYHLTAVEKNRAAFKRKLSAMRKAWVDGKQLAPFLIEIGNMFMRGVRAEIKAADLRQTGLLERTVDFEIVDRVATDFRRRQARARRAAIRQQKKRGRR